MQTNPTAIANHNALVISNVASLCNAIISEIGGAEISKTLNGDSLTRDKIEQLVCIKAANYAKSL